MNTYKTIATAIKSIVTDSVAHVQAMVFHCDYIGQFAIHPIDRMLGYKTYN